MVSLPCLLILDCSFFSIDVSLLFRSLKICFTICLELLTSFLRACTMKAYLRKMSIYQTQVSVCVCLCVCVCVCLEWSVFSTQKWAATFPHKCECMVDHGGLTMFCCFSGHCTIYCDMCVCNSHYLIRGATYPVSTWQQVSVPLIFLPMAILGGAGPHPFLGVWQTLFLCDIVLTSVELRSVINPRRIGRSQCYCTWFVRPSVHLSVCPHTNLTM